MPPENNVQPIEQTATGEIVDQSPTLTDQTQTSSTTETKPEQQTEDKGKPTLLNEKAEEPAGAPEKYEDFKVPEGFELDAKVAEEAGALFKSMNLTQAQGQALVDFYTAKTQEAAAAPYKLWQDTQEAWVNEIKNDPQIGPKLDQVRATVAKAIDGLGDAKLATAFREAMDFTGAGNHPAFIKAFYALAQKVTEGTMVPGGKPSPHGQSERASPRSAAHALFPNLP